MSELWQPAPEPSTELGRYRILSSTAGLRVSPLQLGAMSIGDAWSNFMGSMDKASSFKLLDAFYEAGGNFIDTANNYQNEQSEIWVGEWMTERKNRDQLVIATKFTTEYKGHELGHGKGVNYCGNHKRSLHMSARDSLKKLKTDWIDILYLHWWDHTTSIEEIMDSLHILVQQGKVLYLGISDTPAWVVSAANTYATAHGKTPFSIYQGRWNVLVRDFEREIIPMARHFGMALAPWDVLGGGKFQTRKALEDRRKKGEGLRGLRPEGLKSSKTPVQSEDEEKMSEALAKVASEHGIESVTAIALAYVLSKAPNVFPLVGGRRVEHLQDNIQALKVKLTTKQIEYLESVKPLDVGFPSNFIGPDPKVVVRATRMLPYAFQTENVQNVRQNSSLHSPSQRLILLLPILRSGNNILMIDDPNGTKKGFSFVESLHGGNRASSIIVWATDWFHIVQPLTNLLSRYFNEQWQHGRNYGMIDKWGSRRHLDRGEIEAEVNVMTSAGSDTTAIALTDVLYYLIKNPCKLARLHEELASVLSDNCVIAPCIPEPEEYRPERWLENEEKAKEMRTYFIPFSTGARGCIGRNISYLEQYVLVASLMHRYEFSLPTKDWKLDWEEAFNLRPAQLPLKDVEEATWTSCSGVKVIQIAC
ncbi:hypothetical protein G7Y89_g10969 [Cudoniella acicularis]|uniref:Aldo-keto reductase ausK n=1 Tax=Cudoniella acicularis TaxID=354080 RepID=A0A8H4RBP9_9HELO|nr:hypothetical protein G7Y89_g10969 [Cudoniella acicularis]